MTSMKFLFTYWNWNITSILVTGILLIFHFYTNKFRLNKKSFLFFSGIILFIFATISPLSFLAQNHLFSAHMVKHIVLLLIVPPILLMGTDAAFFEKLKNKVWFKKICNIVFHPIIAWTIGIGSMWILHVPTIFKFINHSIFLSELQMVLLLIFGFIFIWPIFAPINLRKLQPLQSVVYLFTACFGCTVLGILITFAPANMYVSNINNVSPFILNLIESKWGITRSVDQQIGGLIMWVPACTIYITYVLITLSKWYKESEKQTYATLRN